MSKIPTLFILAVCFTGFDYSSAATNMVFKDCDDCPQMVVIPAGRINIGSNKFASEMPVTQVTIPESIAIGKFEITFDEWDACARSNGCQSNPTPSDNGGGRGKRPVINVTWVQVNEYINWLNSKADDVHYRLPSEIEWEFAARSGQTENGRTEYSWGNEIGCDKAHYGGRQGGDCFENLKGEPKQNVPVGSYNPNAFGLYDMHGNVAEWVQDCWHYGYKNLPDTAKQTGGAWQQDECTFRVVRGGSSISPPWHLRMSNRSRLGAVNKGAYFGFRVARTMVQ